MSQLTTVVRSSRVLESDISLVMTFHREGLVAKWSLDSLNRVRACAEERGVKVQLVCVLDNADELTKAIVTTHPVINDRDWLLISTCGSPGLSRNIGILHSNGTYIGVLDGDDYCSENWIAEGFKIAENFGASVVVHPEYVVSFDSKHVLARVIDQRDGKFSMGACVNSNPWVVTSIAHRAVFETVPYVETNVRATGFGYEDWHWNLELVSKGVVHIVSPRTALYYRRKASSVLMIETAAGAIVQRSEFFTRPECWERGFQLVDQLKRHSKRDPRTGGGVLAGLQGAVNAT